MEDFLPTDNPSVKTLDDITNDFPFSSQSQEHILIEGNVAQIGVLEGIYKTNNNLRDDVFSIIP